MQQRTKKQQAYDSRRLGVALLRRQLKIVEDEFGKLMARSINESYATDTVSNAERMYRGWLMGVLACRRDALRAAIETNNPELESSFNH